MAKRSDYISWDEYFMGVAILAAQRSKDPNTQVGACIVSNDNKILSIGYNGMPLTVVMMILRGNGIRQMTINIFILFIVN